MKCEYIRKENVGILLHLPFDTHTNMISVYLFPHCRFSAGCILPVRKVIINNTEISSRFQEAHLLTYIHTGVPISLVSGKSKFMRLSLLSEHLIEARVKFEFYGF